MSEGNGTTLGLHGRVAVVTGASRGLGRALARKLCACGCRVYLNYARSDAEAERTLRELEGLPGTATAVKGDLRRPEVLPDLLQTAHERHGRLDVLVHNAASFRPMSAVDAGAPGDLAGVHDAVALAVDPLLRAAPSLVKLMDGAGRVIAISSNGAREVVPRYVGLGVAKAALESLVRYLAVETAGRGIAVNAVSTAKLDKGPDTPDARTAAMLASRTPAGRLTTPEDVAGVVALLCTDEAAWIHGQVITVDGGLGLPG